MATEILVPKGQTFIDVFTTAGAKTGEYYFGHSPEFTVQIETEETEDYSAEGGVDSLIYSAIEKITRKATLLVKNITAQALELFIIGTLDAAYAQLVGTSVTSTVDLQGGRYYQLGETDANPSGDREVSSIAIPGGTITTDYTQDLVLGRVYIVPGGALAAAGSTIITYDRAAKTRMQIAANDLQTVTCAIRHIAYNQTGTDRDLYAPNVMLRPNGDLTLKRLGGEPASMSFDMSILESTVSGQASLYFDGRAV